MSGVKLVPSPARRAKLNAKGRELHCGTRNSNNVSLNCAKEVRSPRGDREEEEARGHRAGAALVVGRTCSGQGVAHDPFSAMAAPMPCRSHGHSVVQPEVQIDCGFRYFGAVLS